MSDQKLDPVARQAPLVELLLGVPADARVLYEHSPTHHQNIPAGKLCAEAADKIERQRALLVDGLNGLRAARRIIGPHSLCADALGWSAMDEALTKLEKELAP